VWACCFFAHGTELASVFICGFVEKHGFDIGFSFGVSCVDCGATDTWCMCACCVCTQLLSFCFWVWIGEQQQATGILVLVSAFMCGGLRSNDSIEISASFLCVCAAQHGAELC